MIGDGICQETCNSAECSWDGLDCGCAPGCSFTDLPSCKSECMVMDCNYAHLPDYPQCQLDDYIYRYKNIQLIYAAFNSFFPSVGFIERCGSCYELSDPDYCLAYCDDTLWTESPAILKNCELSIYLMRDYCIRCAAPYMNNMGSCQLECAAGLSPHPLVSDVCVPTPDLTTDSAPFVVYVWPKYVGDADGSRARPYQTLSEALSRVFQKYCQIVLLGPEHSLEPSHPSELMNYFTKLSSQNDIRNHYKKLTILPECAAGEECVRPTLYLEPRKLAKFFVPGPRYIIELCTEVTRGELVMSNLRITYRVEDACLPSFSSLIMVSFNMLTLTNVTFQDICGTNSIIDFYTHSSITLINVNFTNVKTYKSVLFQETFMQHCSFSTHEEYWQLQSNVTYIGGVVTMQKEIDLPSQAFLNTKLMHQLQISNVIFTWQSNSTTPFSLLSFGFSLHIEVSNCSFSHNRFLSGYILEVDLPLMLNSETASQYELDQTKLTFQAAPSINILISDCRFQDNELSSGSDLAFHFSNMRQRIVVANCTFSGETVQNVIKVTDDLLPDLQSIYGPAIYVTTSHGLVRVRLPQPSFHVVDSSFRDCVTGSVFYVEKYVHILFRSLALFNVSSQDAALSITSSFNTTIRNCSIEDFRATVLQVTNASGQLVLESSRFEGVKTPARVFSIESNDAVMLANITVSHCSSLDSTVLHTSAPSLSILGCSFLRNSAVYGGAVYAEKVAAVYLSASRFVLNSALQHGAAVFASVFDSLLSISACTFDRNAAGGQGGAVYIEGTAARLLISNCTLQANSGIGSGLYVASIRILAQSTVQTSVFVRNVAHSQGVLSLHHALGSLLVTQSVFENNQGSQEAAIYAGYSAQVATIELAALRFVSNVGESVVRIPTVLLRSSLTATDLRFELNSGVCLLLENTVVVLSNCSFTRNFAQTSPALVVKLNSEVSMTTAVFAENAAEQYAGAVFLTDFSKFTCSACLFDRNSAGTHGGAALVENSAQIDLRNSNFTANSAQGEGSALSFFVAGNSTIEQCLFVRNRAGGEGSISMFSSTLRMKTSTFSDNWSASRSPGVATTLSTFLAEACEFRLQTGLSGAFLYIITLSVVNVSNCSFEQTHSSSLGAIYIEESEIQLRDSRLLDLSADMGSAIFAVSNSKVVLQNVTVSGQQNDSGGALHFVTSSCNVTASRIASFKGTGIYAQGAVLRVAQTEVTGKSHADGRGAHGTALSCLKCIVLDVEHSVFQSLSATNGPVLYIEDSEQASQIAISHSTFRHNAGIGLGAVYAHRASIQLVGNLFISNSAGGDAGQGGAVTLACEGAAVTCKFTVTANTFLFNSASLMGGAVSWQDLQPMFTDNEFQNNTAQYGGDISSYPSHITSLNSSLDFVPSGQLFRGSLALLVLDHLDKKITTDNRSQAEITPISGSTVEVFGQVKATALAGVILLHGFGVTARPGSNVTILVSLLQSSSVVFVNVSMRECVIGESGVNGRCMVCEGGTYSLDPTKPCQTCPAEAICYGNFTMASRPGYWRTSFSRARFLPCPNRDACLGSLSINKTCADGYSGNMCQSCTVGFSRSNKIFCESCPNYTSTILKTIGFAFAVATFALIIVKSTLRSAHKETALHSIYLKTIMNYLQLVMLLGSFNLGWPTIAKALLGVQEAAGSFSEQLFSLDCMTQGFDESSMYYKKVLTMSFVPLCFLAITTLVWLVVAVRRRSAEVLKNELVASNVVLFFLVHPSILKVMFHVFNCEEIEPGEYWVLGYELRCWKGDYWTYALGVALPSIIVWGVGIPTLILLLLVMQRGKLGDLSMKIKFGYLYNGYSQQKYYWEFVSVYRKLTIISIAVFLSRVSEMLQALLVLAVLFFSIILHQVHNPYTKLHMNGMEARSLIVVMVTVLCGLVFFDRVNYSAEIFCEVIIVLANVYFLQAWLKGICTVLFVLMVRKLRFLQKHFYVVDENRVRTMSKQKMISVQSSEQAFTAISSLLKSCYFSKMRSQLNSSYEF